VGSKNFALENKPDFFGRLRCHIKFPSRGWEGNHSPLYGPPLQGTRPKVEEIFFGPLLNYMGKSSPFFYKDPPYKGLWGVKRLGASPI